MIEGKNFFVKEVLLTYIYFSAFNNKLTILKYNDLNFFFELNRSANQHSKIIFKFTRLSDQARLFLHGILVSGGSGANLSSFIQK